MNTEISQRELRNESAEVLRAVKDGECITITNNGVPVAEIVPLRRGRFVVAQVAKEAFADVPSIDLKSHFLATVVILGQSPRRDSS